MAPNKTYFVLMCR